MTTTNQAGAIQGGFKQGQQEEVPAVKIAYFNPELTPKIPENINVTEFLNYFKFPEFFSFYEIQHDEFGNISFVLNQGEEQLNTVRIPERLFLPTKNNIKFPKFLLNISKFTNSKVDYSKRRLVLNQNELLWLVIKHRLQFFSAYKRAYSYLLTKDVQAIIEYSDYNIYNAHNAKVKADHSVAVLDVFGLGELTLEHLGSEGIADAPFVINEPIGENISTPKITQGFVNSLFRDIRVMPASESMASESGKFVMCPDTKSSDDFYRSAGFRLKDEVIETIFGVKSNIPARFKSHVICDSFKVQKWDRPIFTEDLIAGAANETDETIINATVVFMPIDEASGRFMCGEIECSDRFARNKVIKREIIRDQFQWIDLKEGQDLRQCDDGGYIVGINVDKEEVKVYGFDSVKVVECTAIGFGGSYKVVLDCVRKIGSTRIISSTGVKGVTKPRLELGNVSVKSPNGEWAHLDVDLLIGPNSLKAKENTIFLAQAAMAHSLGFNHPEKHISSFDLERINQLKTHVTEAYYTDTKGVKQKCYAGIVPIKISELAYMYKNAKRQSFMTQSGWHLATSGFGTVSEHIWNTCVPPEDIQIIQELTKIIYDEVGKFVNEDGLPVYSVYDIEKHFSLEDVKLETNPMTKHLSKLLVTDNRGFYIYINHTGEYVRMPSAQLIERFTSQIADGSYIYPRLLTVVSQILQTCIVKNSVNGKINLGYIARKGMSRFDKSIALVNKYIDLCQGMLHYKNNYIANLMKPKVFGCDMKQMVDVHVPSGVIVILDHNLYERLAMETDGWFEKNGEFFALTIRNPVLWKAQIQSMKVWDYEMFKDWLRLEKGEDIEQYFNHRYCKDLVLLNPNDAVLQQSDVDGDLMPVFVPKGQEVQKELRKFNIFEHENMKGLSNITSHELDWIEDYRKSEVDANSVYKDIESKDYKTHKVKLSSLDSGEKTFSKYFGNSVVAKGDIGLATFNLWQLQCLLDIYMMECNAGKIVDAEGIKTMFLRKDYDLISFAYTRILQDLVVRGIKWNESGSSEFAPFMLSNIISRTYRNSTYKYFLNTMKLPLETVNKLFEILNWGSSNGMIESIGMFIGFYNSGKVAKYQVTPEFETKIARTFYGKRLDPFFSVRNQIEKAKKDGFKHQMPDGSGGGNAAGQPGKNAMTADIAGMLAGL